MMTTGILNTTLACSSAQASRRHLYPFVAVQTLKFHPLPVPFLAHLQYDLYVIPPVQMFHVRRSKCRLDIVNG
ncbi:hypothetical protein GALMADRAFT_242263 [Galerina marginata CBS 339.88]|uniref:Uncharacterized protein n=1 Tax=Galerina marginata (strain CBS 339.88) TaxID=685588 RepID=A0A067TCI3_GALM3|nr:hypothetical protein GALMADRAFT_242263 [Galerina marginata CBS 339.88]